MKVMEEIFTGTMRRFMGSGEPISNRDPRGNEGRAYGNKFMSYIHQVT